ncbi:MAG: hypothetical protein K0S23_2739 [Fluviicola sp.]|jgi:hypothetical protein|nr:hypothetical protein [Fluviicola sp.]
MYIVIDTANQITIHFGEWSQIIQYKLANHMNVSTIVPVKQSVKTILEIFLWFSLFIIFLYFL